MLPLLSVPEPLPPVYLDVDDVPHLRAWREARITRSPIRRWLLRSQVPGLLWAERRATAAARRSFVCSEVDRDYLSHRWGLPRVEVLPNAVEIPEPVAGSPEPTLLFIGQMDYLPNATAARFLLDEIWPLVRQRLPRARLMIAGPSTGTLEHGGVPEGVELLGVVDDLKDLYARTRVACAPIRAGSGTRIKILEAAAFGRAVVSTRMGAEGLELEHDREILLGDTREELADACCRLLQSPECAARLGAAARERVVALYDSSTVLERVRPLRA
jgi:glycosyltransferase involved in cell wall biosynthesis